MDRFEHILLTRFNVKLYDNVDNPKGLDPAWLEQRLQLFEKFCYPSLNNQSNQNFKWLVLFHASTPESFKTKIREYSQWKNFIPLYIDFAVSEEGGCPEQLKALIKSHLSDDCKFLITTRIDNDDAVCEDYIQKIQSYFREQECQGIVFPFGYQLLNNGSLYLDFSIGNHFISLIERFEANSFETVFSRHHTLLYEICPIQQVFCAPAWLEVVHGGNIANHHKSGVRVSSHGLRQRFSIKAETILQSEKRLQLRIEQIKFLIFDFPRYLTSKLFNRLRYHGLSNVLSFAERYTR